MKPFYLSLKPLIQWRPLAQPLDWPAIFGRPARLELELGCGNGALLVRRALHEPQSNFVGLDMDWRSIKRALRRINQAGCVNIRLLQVRAPVALGRLFGPENLDGVYCTFPCPWPEAKHQQRRLFSHGFLKLVNNRLRKGASLWIVSDQAEYLEWILGQAEGTGFSVGWRETSPQWDTKYEHKWYEQGQDTFYRLDLEKKNHLQAPVVKEHPVKFHWIDHCRPENLALTEQIGDILVSFKDFIYDPRQKKGMLRTVVVEEDLSQAFWIDIAPDRGAWRIRLAPGCGVLPTAGVQTALDLARDQALKTVE
jgi:tRNA (guanine-N7-)-methyltransferase